MGKDAPPPVDASAQDAVTTTGASVPFYALELMVGLIVSFVFDPRQLPIWVKSVIVAATSFFLPYLCYNDPHHCADVWPISSVFDHLQISEPRTMSLLIGFLFTVGVVGYLLLCYFISLFVSVRYRRDRKSHRYMIASACFGVLLFLLFVAFVSEHSPFGIDDDAPRAFVKSTVNKKGLRIKGEDRASYLRQWYRLQREAYLDSLVSDPLLYCGVWILLCGVVLLCLFALYEFKAAANEEGVPRKKKRRSSSTSRRRSVATTTEDESTDDDDSSSSESDDQTEEETVDDESENSSPSSTAASSSSEDEDSSSSDDATTSTTTPTATTTTATTADAGSKRRKRNLRKGGKGGAAGSAVDSPASAPHALLLKKHGNSTSPKPAVKRVATTSADGFTVVQRRSATGGGKPREARPAGAKPQKSAVATAIGGSTATTATTKRVVRRGKDGKKIPKSKAIEGVWGI